MTLQTLPLPANIVIFLLAVVVIGVFGVRITHVARKLAATTGLGEAVMGAVIGVSTFTVRHYRFHYRRQP